MPKCHWPTFLGVGEKAFRKGHRYLTNVNDVDRGTVEFVSEGRGKASLSAFFESHSAEQLAGIEAVAMDVWEPFVLATRKAVPLAPSKIVFDRFHVMQHMTEAVDVVRRRENRLPIAEADGRSRARSTCGSPPRRTFIQTSGRVPLIDLKTARTWGINENLRHLWSFRVEG